MKNLLKQTHRWIIRHAVYGSLIQVPFLAYAYWAARRGRDVSTAGGILGFLNGLAFIWILSLAYMISALLFHKEFRESFVPRLAGFRERDEREQLITASASRNTFLLTLALEIVLFIMSVTTVHVYKDSDGHGVLTAGMGFSSRQLDIYAPPSDLTPPPQNTRWDIGGTLLPPNMTMVLLLMILVQIGAFRIFSQHEYEARES